MNAGRSSPAESASTMPDQITALKESIDREIATLTDLPLEEKNAKNEDIKSMILYYADGTKAIEDRRNRMAEFAWQSLAIAVTASAVILALSITAFIKGLLLIVLGAIIITHILKLFEYQRQSSFRYPYLELPEYEGRWKWDSSGNQYITSIKANPYTGRSNTGEDQLNYLQGLKEFVGSYAEETFDQELADNIIQMFTLQVRHYYKNRFYLRLLKYDQYTPLIILVLVLVYVIVFLILSYVSPGTEGYLR